MPSGHVGAAFSRPQAKRDEPALLHPRAASGQVNIATYNIHKGFSQFNRRW